MNEIINIVAVLGSGVMGSGIAALLANAGCQVYLLDIVPDGATDRNILAKSAIEKQLKAKPAGGFTHKRNVGRVIPGNLEDDLTALEKCDWIIEVVLENITVKQQTYRKIEQHRKTGSIVSSNTSTLPLHVLVEGMPESFAQDFMITHFFNPPRFLPLLEITGGEQCKQDHIDRIHQFADIHLGKGVVVCKDTPGFLANRIGIFWMLAGLMEALDCGISVEDADAVMSRPVGIPKTALFGLYDLIGIDLMPLIAKAMLQTLPQNDPFRTLYKEPELITNMIAQGYTGRKGKGGFYKLDKRDGKKIRLVKDLNTGEYRTANRPTLASISAAASGLAALVNHEDIGGQFAKSVLVRTLHYAASLVPQISDDIINIDSAMRLGFAWKYGPFELIDKLSTDSTKGSDWLIAACDDMGLTVPPLLRAASGKTFYKTDGNMQYHLNMSGEYDTITVAHDSYMLADRIRGNKPVIKSGGAALWDLGDGVAGLQLTTKMNTIDNDVLDMMMRSVEKVERDFNAMVIATDANQFSLGANLGFFMYLANLADWNTLSSVIRQGQQAVMALKYAPFPVVASLSGMALGGGCEITLHCDAVQAHMESYPGLVEMGVGVVPGWGGCKEMLFRHVTLAEQVAADIAAGKRPTAMMPSGPMPAISKAFEYIMLAKVASSAEEAKDMLILNDKSRISMNRRRVLPDAKALSIELARDYVTPETRNISLPGESAKTALLMAIDTFIANGKATPHDALIGQHLASILSGGNTDVTNDISEQDILDLEHDRFIELVKTKATRDRIEHMLETNKPLRN